MRVGAQDLSATNPLPAKITQAAQVLSLSPEEARRSHPVDLTGVITCFDQRAQLCFVQDRSAGIFVYDTNLALRVRTGDLVELRGVTAPGRYSPIVNLGELKVIGKGELPNPRRVSIEELVSGRLDCQWVEVKGTIHRASENWGHLLVELANGSSRLKVRVLQYVKGVENQFIDAKVRVRGVVGSLFNAKGQLTGFHLLVPSLAQVVVEDPPVSDPFSSPVRSIRSLMAYSYQQPSDRRVRVQGTVTLQWLGKALYIKDESGGVKVRTEQATPVKVGDTVDVIGFPSAGGYTPLLEDSEFKVIGSKPPPPPVSIAVTQALSGQFDNELVQLEARLLESDETLSDQKVLVLEADKRVFRARLQSSALDGKKLSLLNGSLLKITGVCSVQVDESLAPIGFTLQMRSPEDIAVLQRPSWWRLTRLIWVLGFCGGGVMAGLIWMVMLRRRVQQQTETIRRRETALEERYRDLFENANDILYTHDLAGQLTSINKAAEQLLGYNHAEMLRMNIADVLAPEYRQVVNEQLHRKLTAGAPRTNYDVEVLAKDGRRLVLEVNTRLQFEEGQLLGIQGMARDITARKHAEAALKESERQLRKSIEEREQIGRDLHDGIIQSIYAVGLNLDDCRRLMKKEPAEVETRLQKVLADLNAVIRDVRSFILGLESDLLKGQEFKTALKSLVLTLGEPHCSRFILQIDSSSSGSLIPKQATNLLHVAREAISNSVRHANAPKTILSLQMHNEHIRFEVQDDGKGFNSDSTEPHGYGLRNMAARAQELGAGFSVISEIGKGTRIVLDIPLKSGHQTVLT